MQNTSDSIINISHIDKLCEHKQPGKQNIDNSVDTEKKLKK